MPCTAFFFGKGSAGTHPKKPWDTSSRSKFFPILFNGIPKRPTQSGWALFDLFPPAWLRKKRTKRTDISIIASEICGLPDKTLQKQQAGILQTPKGLQEVLSKAKSIDTKQVG